MTRDKRDIPPERRAREAPAPEPPNELEGPEEEPTHLQSGAQRRALLPRDVRATEMGERGEINVGQLRERWGGEAFLLGFTTATGTVTAASDWGAEPERKRVRTLLDDSVEQLFTELQRPEFLLDVARERDGLGAKRLERAIGVIYRPETERWSHYFRARVSEQFDALVHLDETTALEPLDASERWAGEPAETFHPACDRGRRVAPQRDLPVERIMAGTIHVLPQLGRWAVVREGEEQPIVRDIQRPSAAADVLEQERGQREAH